MYPLLTLSEPTLWLYLLLFVYGVIVGSFLNVYIYRFHTGKSLNGHSHCLSCGTQLRWYELFPLISYLGLRGRCMTCGCSIPQRYFIVELCTGVLFVLATLVTQNLGMLLLWWAILSVLIVITVYDYYHFIIPDELTLALSALAAGLYGWQYAAGEVSLVEIGHIVLAALAGSGFFLFLWLISRGTWLGFGDVKLAIPLGMLVGPSLIFSFVVLSFWIGAAVSLLLIAVLKWRRGQAGLHLSGTNLTMKSTVPFAPFLVASCLVTIFTHFNVLEFFQF